MQRQAVPLIIPEPPSVATGMEKVVGHFSGMLVKARRGGTVTFVDAGHIIIDNADEYVLRKFVGLKQSIKNNVCVGPGCKTQECFLLRLR